MHKEISAKVALPGKISKEFKLGINVSTKALEFQLTDKISLVVEKEQLLLLLDAKDLPKTLTQVTDIKDTEIP